jgi:phosphate transport system protein
LKILQKEIDKLKKMILQLSSMVEDSVYRSVRSVSDRDPSLAIRVIDDDMNIDRMEVEIEEECLKILALHQPVAVDLRFIVAVLKMNNDLERIGDLSVNIAKRAKFLSTHERVKAPFDCSAMAEKVQLMLRLSIDALVNMDASIARRVVEMDDEIDKINRDMYARVEDQIRQSPAASGSLIRLLSVSKQLERIADHTTNLAEDVIYMIEGEIVRHKNA